MAEQKWEAPPLSISLFLVLQLSPFISFVPETNPMAVIMLFLEGSSHVFLNLNNSFKLPLKKIIPRHLRSMTNKNLIMYIALSFRHCIALLFCHRVVTFTMCSTISFLQCIVVSLFRIIFRHIYIYIYIYVCSLPNILGSTIWSYLALDGLVIFFTE